MACRTRLAVREHGVIQFLHVFHTVKSRENDCLKWGDEIEYHIMDFNDAAKEVKIALVAHDAIVTLEEEDKAPPPPGAILSAWRPEYGSWMIEGKGPRGRGGRRRGVSTGVRARACGVRVCVTRSHAGEAVRGHNRCVAGSGG